MASFTKWFSRLILSPQVGAECSNAAYSGKCGKGGDLGFSFPEEKKTVFFLEILKKKKS